MAHWVKDLASLLRHDSIPCPVQWVEDLVLQCGLSHSHSTDSVPGLGTPLYATSAAKKKKKKKKQKNKQRDAIFLSLNMEVSSH